MRKFGQQLGAIALLAMLVRALVPAGYMLAEAGTPDGRYLVVQMCDDHRGVSRFVNLDTGEIVEKSANPDDASDKNNDAPCVFASAVQMTSPPSLVAPVVFAHAVPAEFIPQVSVTPGRGIAAPPPPATGPPVH